MVDTSQILIFTSENSARLNYTVDLFFHELIGLNFTITTDAIQFQNHEGIKLNYSSRRFRYELRMTPSAFLFENDIHQQEIWMRKSNIPMLFPSENTGDDFGFDLFAASFFLVSRYEEYLPFTADEYDRFPAKESFVVKHGIEKLPLINMYAELLKEKIRKNYPQVNFPEKKFQFELTYDIDNAYAYLHKGFWREYGGLLCLVLCFAGRGVSERKNVLQKKIPDPFDSYELQRSLREEFHLNPKYFFLLGDYATYDKNLNWENADFRKLIKGIDEQYEIGIHPSFQSNCGIKIVEEEIKRLKKITAKPIVRSRQHFLKLTFPETYQNLSQLGIKEDYTMGFSELTGFRASIAAPFYFYDLQKEKKTSLRIFPFAIMDASLFYYKKYSPQQALDESISLLSDVKKVNGYFQFLAHNDLLNDKMWNGWKEKFAEFLKLAVSA
jgi:hypothetical protein